MTETQFDFVTDLEPRVFMEVNPFGKVWYRVQWFSRSGTHPPEPTSWVFRSRRRAERWATKRQKHRLEGAFRSVP